MIDNDDEVKLYDILHHSSSSLIIGLLEAELVYEVYMAGSSLYSITVIFHPYYIISTQHLITDLLLS